MMVKDKLVNLNFFTWSVDPEITGVNQLNAGVGFYLMSSSEANRTMARANRVSSSRRMILSKSDGLRS